VECRYLHVLDDAVSWDSGREGRCEEGKPKAR